MIKVDENDQIQPFKASGNWYKVYNEFIQENLLNLSKNSGNQNITLVSYLSLAERETWRLPELWMHYLNHSLTHRQKMEVYQLKVLKHNIWPIIGWPLNYADPGFKLKQEQNKQTNNKNLAETSVATVKGKRLQN